MSNARKKRKQASITKRSYLYKRLNTVRKPEGRKSRFMQFIQWLKSILKGK